MSAHVERSAWVDGPGSRGTFQILLTCIATIVLCSYVVLHYDVPKTSQSRFSTAARKSLFALGAMLAPEFVASYAFFDWLEARKLTAWFNRQGVEWTITHSFYFLMGGLTFDNSKLVGKPTASRDIQTLDVDNVTSLLLEPGVDFNAITREKIRKNAKSDRLITFLACIQAVYILVQVFARIGSQMSVTCLEVSTAAYVPLTLLSFVFWWKKPFGATNALQIPIHSSRSSKYLSLSKVPSPMPPVIFDQSLVSRWANCSAFACIAIIFAAPHLGLWNSTVFATHAERLVWRLSSLCMLVIPILEVPLLIRFHSDRSKGSGQITSSMIIFLASLYCAFRVCILAETFYSFHSAPSDIYREVRWSAYIPHFP